jgi:hypothetical protein
VAWTLAGSAITPRRFGMVMVQIFEARIPVREFWIEHQTGQDDLFRKVRSPRLAGEIWNGCSEDLRML